MQNSKILLDAFSLPPEKAIEFFESKGYKISFDWFEMKRRAHVKAFTVAGVVQLDVLKDIRKSLDKAQKEGLSYSQFKADIAPTLEKKGWYQKRVVKYKGEEKEVNLASPWRLKLIYNTNLRVAAMAGKYKGLMDASKNRPYWKYSAIMDGQTRESHRLLHGKIFHHKDPFWETHYPPNGWNCRCSVSSVSNRQIERKGLKIHSGNEFVGKIKIDDGWDYNPGKEFWKPDFKAYAPEMAKKAKDFIKTANDIKTETERRIIELDLRKDTRKVTEGLKDKDNKPVRPDIEVVKFNKKNNEALMLADKDVIKVNQNHGTETRDLHTAFRKLEKKIPLRREEEFMVQAFTHETVHIKAKAAEQNYSLKRMDGLYHELGTYHQGLKQYPAIMEKYGVEAKFADEMIKELPVEKTLKRLINSTKSISGINEDEFARIFEKGLNLSLEDSFESFKKEVLKRSKLSEKDFVSWFDDIYQEFEKEIRG